jgi:hypothetical protein
MAIEGQLVQQQTARYSENLFNPFLSFETDYTYTITDGVGVAEISNTDEFSLSGNGSMKVRFLATTDNISWNADVQTNSVIKNTGIHFIQFAVYKNNPTASVNLTVDVFINNSLSSNRSVAQTIYSDNGFSDENWNIYYQSFNANEGDVISLSWSCDSDDDTAIIYMDNFKLERSNQNLFAPTFYTKPTYLNTKWQQVIDFTNTFNLVEDTPTNFQFSGTSTKNYIGDDIIGVDLQVDRLNDLFTAEANFLIKTPSGTDLHIEVQFIINGITYRGDDIYLFRTDGGDQYANVVFKYPVTQEFIDNNATITLTARGAEIQIRKRSLIATIQSNY